MPPAEILSTGRIEQTHREDLDASKLLHHNARVTSKHQESYLTKVKNKNHESYSSLTKTYFSYWSKSNPAAETEEDTKRVQDYKALTNGYYDLATDLYERFDRAMARHEHYLAYRAGFKRGDRILDFGSGVGGPGRTIAHFTGAHITGLNNNDYQIARSRHFAALHKLENQLDYVKCDFMDLPFEDNSYDGCYAIEATTHAPDLVDVYSEAFRVIKPGSIFAAYEWVITDKYDPENPEHRRIIRGIEVGAGVVRLHTRVNCLNALKAAGFEILESEDRAINDDENKWYFPLSGETTASTTWWDFFAMQRSALLGRIAIRITTKVLEMVGLAPPGTCRVSDLLIDCGEAVVESGRLGIFSPMFFFVARKPLSSRLEE
ncbi:Delta(24)-sterol C-methyltransferase [Actinomortierella ambigua]|nr:Delta(24)-sterol C-methyltransferase [Actinomortierella ambigua]